MGQTQNSVLSPEELEPTCSSAQMDVALSGLQMPSGPLRRETPLESRSRAHVLNPLLDSKIYAKLRSNSLIEAEPPELHFSGFELGKDYVKNLKLINVSSEVLNIHIIPTQTRHFQSTYTKKYRLIPGLAYTLKVSFCPNEWRYFYDCARVHCKGEENLLIPVHAYPIIDDLHIPPHIDLSAVPLGQSETRVIPLRCSFPIDFEFQVSVIQPHEAFSIRPLTGVIPASGEVKLMVTFSPLRYETSQVTFQIVVSQFNSKPQLCTVTGSAAPHAALSRLERKMAHGDTALPDLRGPSAVGQLPPRSKTKYRSTKEADRSKLLRDVSTLKPAVDVSTPAGVAKMLIQNTDKLSSKSLKEALSCGSMAALQNKQMKEALFVKKVQQNVKEEQANQHRWRVHLGRDPVSKQSRRLMLEEREMALHEYTVKWGDVRQEQELFSRQSKLSSSRVLHEAGQAPEGAPSFQLSSGFQLEQRQRALQLFQQAARKVVIRCRISRRLACFRKLVKGMRHPPAAQKDEEKTSNVKISPDKVFPFSFPTFCDEGDPLAQSNLVTMPVAAIDGMVTTHIPFFKLQVPQHFKLKGYRPVSAWEAFNSHTPSTLARPLRTGAPPDKEAEDIEAKDAVSLSITVPEDPVRPCPAIPLTVFNPAPGSQSYNETHKYPKSHRELRLCPLPRHCVPESSTCGSGPQNDWMDCEEVIEGIITWENFDSMNQRAATSSRPRHRSVNYSTDMPTLTDLPPLTDNLTQLMDKRCEDSGFRLTLEMMRAQFVRQPRCWSNSQVQ